MPNYCCIDQEVQAINIKSSGKTRSPLCDRYLSALIAQRLACSLRKWKVPGSNPSVDKNFFILELPVSARGLSRESVLRIPSVS